MINETFIIHNEIKYMGPIYVRDELSIRVFVGLLIDVIAVKSYSLKLRMWLKSGPTFGARGGHGFHSIL